MNTPWIQTHSGRRFPLTIPLAEDVDWRDMAVSLGRLCRFGGHATAFYSVAQHSVHTDQVVEQAVRSTRGRALLLSAVPEAAQGGVQSMFRHVELDDDALRRLRLAALLHDGHEAYIGDITTPVAKVLTQCAGHDHVANLKARIDSAINAAAGLPWPLPTATRAAIKAGDLIMLATERRDLMTDGPEWDQDLPATASFAIKPEPEHRAADIFLQRLNTLLSN